MDHSLFVMMLVSAIVTETFAHYSDERNCQHCTDCCNNKVGCISSEMKVEELRKGIVSVSELSAGDIIRGYRGVEKTRDWCRIDAVYPREGVPNATTYNGFTKDHMIIDGETVRQHGQEGIAVNAQLYTLTTECDAAVNADGQAFTPISTTFCPQELTWGEYLVLIAAIRRVTSRTGYFWYLSDAFHDNKAAKVPNWADMLPDMCTEMLRCARGGECKKFEKIVDEFVHEHLNKKYVLIVERVFPNLGGDAIEKGTVSHAVRQNDRSNTILISTLSVIAIMALVIAVLVYYLIRLSKKKEKSYDGHFSSQNVNYQKV